MATKKQLAAFKRIVSELSDLPFSKAQKFNWSKDTHLPGGSAVYSNPAGLLLYLGEYEEHFDEETGEQYADRIPEENYGDPDCWLVILAP